MLLDSCEVGVEVPGVKTTEELLVDDAEEARPVFEAASALITSDRFCANAVRLGGDVVARGLRAGFNVLFMSGVRIRAGAGGKKGE